MSGFLKVGILTLPLHTNFGGNLQAYALLRFLRKNSVDAYFLCREKNKYPLWKYALSIPKGIFNKYIFGKDAPIFKSIKEKLEYDRVSVNAKFFIENEINPKSFACHSSEELMAEVERLELDAVVVGSDQIWRFQYAPSIEDYFLGFIAKGKNILKISYAASFGTDEWQYDSSQTKRLSQLLSEFSYVSVRERSAVLSCGNNFGVQVDHVLDPTMLLDVSDYTRLFSGNEFSCAGMVSTYILDESLSVSRIFSCLHEKYGELRRLNTSTEDREASVEKRIAPPTGQWLHGIYDAELLVTDSFHGCVFSIIFNTPFLVYGNESRGLARFESLLEEFGLEDRMVNSAADVISKSEKIIDWHLVNERLEQRRLDSARGLLGALGLEYER
tara:strand:- start:6826 stop:7983 length:1158 start_codon:yes stop_codon:yes gene_type:complete